MNSARFEESYPTHRTGRPVRPNCLTPAFEAQSANESTERNNRTPGALRIPPLSKEGCAKRRADRNMRWAADHRNLSGGPICDCRIIARIVQHTAVSGSEGRTLPPRARASCPLWMSPKDRHRRSTLPGARASRPLWMSPKDRHRRSTLPGARESCPLWMSRHGFPCLRYGMPAGSTLLTSAVREKSTRNHRRNRRERFENQSKRGEATRAGETLALLAELAKMCDPRIRQTLPPQHKRQVQD